MKNRTHLELYIASALVASAGLTTAHADTATVTPVVLSTDVVKAHLRKLQTSFGRAPGLTFTEHLGVQTSGTTAGPQTKFLDITGELTKPPKYKFTMPKSGTLISDGVSELSIDSTSTHYNLHASPKDFTVGDRWDFISTKVLSGNASILDESLLPYLYDHIEDKDFVDPTETQLIGFASTLNGKPVYDIDYHNESDDIHLLIDPSTDELVGTHSTYVAPNGLVTEVIENVNVLTLEKTAPLASDFLTTPPPNATSVAIPVQVTPPASKSKGSSKSSGAPKRTLRSFKAFGRTYYY